MGKILLGNIQKNEKNGKPVYKDVWGNRLYPVCEMEKNEDILYAAFDMAVKRREEEEWSDESCEEVEKIQCAIDSFGKYVYGGMVYATAEEGGLIMDCISSYPVE